MKTKINWEPEVPPAPRLSPYDQTRFGLWSQYSGEKLMGKISARSHQ